MTADVSVPNDTPADPADIPADALPGRGPLWKRLPVVRQLRTSVGLQRGMLVAGVVITGIFLVTAVFAPLIAPYGATQLRTGTVAFGAQKAPSAAHLLGTTVGGYDVLSRVVWGTRTALLVMIAAVVLSIFLGIFLGLVSGYFGGWVDRVLVVIADAIYAFPSLLLAIVAAIVISRGQSSLWGGILAAAVSITVVFVPQYFRVVRSEVVRVKAEAFVESAKVIGTPPARIMTRHVLRNSVRTLPLIVTLNCSEAILTLAGLGFLGFGIEPSKAAEWGYDLNKALSDVTSGIWWTSVFPGVAIVLTVLGVTLVGESLNDLADPRLRTRRAAGRRGARAAVQSEADVVEVDPLEVPVADDAGPVTGSVEASAARPTSGPADGSGSGSSSPTVSDDTTGGVR